MSLNIKNKEFVATAKALAQITGETITAAGLVALKRELERQKTIKRLLKRDVGDDALAPVRAVQKRYASRPASGQLTDDDVLGYDDFGAPTR